MEKAIIVYKTDTWHTYESRDMIGISTEGINGALKLVAEQCMKEGHKGLPDTRSIQQLKDIAQTQNYQGEGEFVLEEVKLNKLW